MRHLSAKRQADFLENKIRQNAILVSDPTVGAQTDAQGYETIFGKILGCTSQVHADNLAAKVRRENPEWSIVVVYDDGRSRTA